MEKDRFDELMEQLASIERLLALLLVKDMDTQTEQAVMLDSIGFQPKKIANYLGTTAQTIRSTLYRVRQETQEDEEE